VQDTIFAPATAPGRAGVAIIRLSGHRAREAAMALGGRLTEPRRLVRARLRDPKTAAPLDDGLAVWFAGPESFTGEDVVELHCHGGRAVVAAILAALGGIAGCRLAEPGEFSRRAYLNDKMDLLEAEGLADLIDADTDRQRQRALDQMGGRFSETLLRLADRLTRERALLEAWIDFPDEEVPDQTILEVTAGLEELNSALETLLQGEARGRRLRDGLVVAIVGPPNAGKSSLLNRLADQDIAIVSDTAGTTRDSLEVALDLNGYPVVLVDTAGLRETTDPVEAEGVRRARVRAEAADVVLHLVDPVADATEIDIQKGAELDACILTVISKADLVQERVADTLYISSVSGEGLDALTTRLSDLADSLISGRADAVLSRERHRQAVVASQQALNRAREGLAAGLPIELVAEDLRAAGQSLGRITGRVDVDDLLDVIFSTFCLGK